jgi:hypothetical protein
MIRILFVSVSFITLLLWSPAIGGMQHRMGGQMPMGGQSETQESSPGQHPTRDHGRMGMMCPMMAMIMDPAGMGVVSGQQMEPKAVGRMLQLRGDMLKAIGDVLVKHGKAMEEVH